jgi:hypothetical protein
MQKGDLLLFKYVLSDSIGDDLVYRNFGYFIETDLPGSNVYYVELCNNDGSNNPLKVYKKEVIKNFGQIKYETIDYDYPEWSL